MTPDPKLVEALAEWLHGYYVDDLHDPTRAWANADEDWKDDSRHAARTLLADLRLVQLPEEPSEWEVQWGSDDWIGFQTMEDAVNFANEHRPSTTGRIRAVYHVVKYSDPQEVEP